MTWFAVFAHVDLPAGIIQAHLIPGAPESQDRSLEHHGSDGGELTLPLPPRQSDRGHAWTLLGRPALRPPPVHQCCRPKESSVAGEEFDHSFWDLTLQPPDSRIVRVIVRNVLKAPGDALQLSTDYSDFVATNSAAGSPAPHDREAIEASKFEFIPQTLVAEEKAEQLLQHYFPQLYDLAIRHARLPVVVCTGTVVTDVDQALGAAQKCSDTLFDFDFA